MQPRRILIYGDSNVWGDKGFGENGAPLGRYATKQQWPNILQQLLGDEYDIIQAGLCGWTAGEYAEQAPYLGGKIGYEIALREASPVSGVVIALGVNDAQNESASGEQIVADLQWYSAYPKPMQRTARMTWLAVVVCGILRLLLRQFSAMSRLLANYSISTKSYVLLTQPLVIHLMTMTTMRLMASISHCTGIGEWRRECTRL